MNRYDCNNVLDYARVAKRMCKAVGDCLNCPLNGLDCEATEITPEHVKIVQKWSDTHPYIMPTDQQKEILRALGLLGFRYLVRNKNNRVYAYAEYPWKGSEVWSGIGKHLCSSDVREEILAIVSPLVKWEDDVPLCITEALKQQEEVNHNEEIQL